MPVRRSAGPWPWRPVRTVAIAWPRTGPGGCRKDRSSAAPGPGEPPRGQRPHSSATSPPAGGPRRCQRNCRRPLYRRRCRRCEPNRPTHCAELSACAAERKAVRSERARRPDRSPGRPPRRHRTSSREGAAYLQQARGPPDSTMPARPRGSTPSTRVPLPVQRIGT